MTSKNRCRDCKWWHDTSRVDDYPEMGDCRINSPQLVQVGDLSRGIEFDTVWPRTDARDWCACWTDKESEWVPIGQPVSVAIERLCRAASALHNQKD